ncbi:hypothetical protein [Methylovirgula sp. 4M-Z18]|uniref:hypothetical protein n=1 Tax=Methylovirgula sp. 4M-Z18 TaxID=2293567 RepID=UPI000E2EB3BA|nr:hypothetical protein [Methylovirgula sp. 4M-Z18]
MAKQQVLVVSQLFTLNGRHVARGAVLTDTAEMDEAALHHPDKVTRALHEVVQETPAEEARHEES